MKYYILSLETICDCIQKVDAKSHGSPPPELKTRVWILGFE